MLAPKSERDLTEWLKVLRRLRAKIAVDKRKGIDTAAREKDVDLFEAALQALPRDAAEIIRLRYSEGYSDAHIMRTLYIPTRTYYRQRKRAIQVLLEVLSA